MWVFHLTPGDPKPTWKLSCNHKTTTETTTQSCSCDHLNLYQKHSKGCNNNPKTMQKCCCHNNVLSSACIIHHSPCIWCIIHHSSLPSLSSSVSIKCESWIPYIAYINHNQHQYQSPSVIIISSLTESIWYTHVPSLTLRTRGSLCKAHPAMYYCWSEILSPGIEVYPGKAVAVNYRELVILLGTDIFHPQQGAFESVIFRLSLSVGYIFVIVPCKVARFLPLPSPELTAQAPENRSSQKDLSSSKPSIFRCEELLVSGMVSVVSFHRKCFFPASPGLPSLDRTAGQHVRPCASNLTSRCHEDAQRVGWIE